MSDEGKLVLLLGGIIVFLFGLTIYLGFEVDEVRAKTKAVQNVADQCMAELDTARVEMNVAKAIRDEVDADRVAAIRAKQECYKELDDAYYTLNMSIDVIWGPMDGLEIIRASGKPKYLKSPVGEPYVSPYPDITVPKGSSYPLVDGPYDAY